MRILEKGIRIFNVIISWLTPLNVMKLVKDIREIIKEK